MASASHVFFALVLLATSSALVISRGGEDPEVNVELEAFFKPHNEPQRVELPNMDNNASLPRMLVTQGCDGSTAILQHAHAILELHGIHAQESSSKELLFSKNNRFSGQHVANFSVTMHVMKNHLDKKGLAMMFKAIAGRDHENILSGGLLNMHTLVVQNSRKNMVDQVICMVRDCFDKQVGYPVDDDGEESDLCFHRRENDIQGNYKALINTQALLNAITRIREVIDDMDTDLKRKGYYVEAVHMEDLLDFEWNDERFDDVVETWCSLLSAWGIQPDKFQLKKYLKQNMGTRHPPAFHKQLIHNVDEVKETLEAYPALKWMLRE